MEDHYWEDIASEEIDGVTDSSVWTAVQIWIDRPHLLNRRISGVADVLRYEGASDTCDFTPQTSAWSATLRRNLQHPDGILSQEASKTDVLLVREMISRTAHYQNEYEAVLISKQDNWAIFVPLRGDESAEKTSRRSPSASCTYKVWWKQSSASAVQLKVSVLRRANEDGPLSKSEEWLKNSLFPKLISWTSKSSAGNGAEASDKSSLKLVSVKEYTRTLLQLKDKYSRQLMESWTESTDPIKFVSEDLCIAAYLLTLWRSSSDILPRFADLGCGNGLLVHILSSEGCPGVGIDVRCRKIWTSFAASAKLEERTLDPSTDIFPVDWIIGNHSDELTPWIPYIAARSSYRCNFFLLPCCAFDFNKKFSKPGNESQYQAYYKYVHVLCQEFGFVTEQDTLRIPSTKKRCFIGRSRTYSQTEQAAQEVYNRAFVATRLDDRPTAASFVVRQAVEVVRNCSRLPQTVKDQIIHRLMEELLKKPFYVEGANGRWNAGRGLSLSQLSERLEPELLTAMRSQCGGLQTFVRNHKFIFDVADGCVRLRNYASYEPTKPLLKAKNKSKTSRCLQSSVKKPCWFFHNHPDGCPLVSANCFYAHEELQP